MPFNQIKNDNFFSFLVYNNSKKEKEKKCQYKKTKNSML